MALNQWTGMGRLVRDPELRRTGSGISVANFTIAVDRDAKGQDGEKEADFVDCVAWRGTADFVSKYFRKGSLAVVSGRLQSRKWNDKDGNRRTAWEIQANNVYFGESKKTEKPSGYSAPAAQPSGYSAAPADFSHPYSGQQMGDFEMLDDDDEALPF